MITVRASDRCGSLYIGGRNGLVAVRRHRGVFGQRLGGRAVLSARDFREVLILQEPAPEVVHERLRAEKDLVLELCTRSGPAGAFGDEAPIARDGSVLETIARRFDKRID